MGGFKNYLTTKLGQLVIAAIQSPNYAAASAGWIIRKDGSVEFNDGTFRGYIVGGSLFIYSGTPALGNPPVFSVTSASTDPFGNTITPGIFAGKYGGVQAGLSTSGTIGLLSFPVPGSFSKLPEIGAGTSNSGAELEIQGPAESAAGQTDYFFQIYGSYSAGGGGGAFWQMTYVDPSGGLHSAITAGPGGVSLPVVAALTAVKPGTGGSPTNPAQQEDWHAITNAAGVTGTMRVKMLAEANMAIIDMNCVITSDSSTGTTYTFGSLPSAAYYPLAARQFPASAQQPQGTAPSSPRLEIPASGPVTVQMPGFATAGRSCGIGACVAYPLD